MIQRIFYPLRAIIWGLLTAQVLATIHVYHSNMDLYRAITLLKETGYLVVPNAVVLPSLKTLGSAFWGGLFFTLSVGAGLSLFSFLAAWLWDRVFGKKKGALLPLVFLWAFPLFAANNAAVSPMVAAYFVTVPLVVFIATLKILPQKTKTRAWHKGLVPVLPIALLTVLWTVQADRFLFLDIRDFLLLSNSIGQKVDAFYYRYTLYPANVFKTLEQKTLKACTLTGTAQGPVLQRIASSLLDHDYLPVQPKQGRGAVDLEIEQTESKLVFKTSGETALEVSLNGFFAQPAETLRQLSQKTDGNAFFRQATIVCLLFGFPVLLYLLVFSVIHFAAGTVAGWNRAPLTAAALSLLLGLALLAPLMVGRTEKIEPGQLHGALQSENWRQRVTALRTLVDEKGDIARFDHANRFLTSVHLPERYWITKALAMSRSPEAYGQLVQLLDDRHPNVVSMALFSLGQRRDRRAITEILNRMETSDHWYNQWYAYRALRALGWRQRPQNH